MMRSCVWLSCRLIWRLRAQDASAADTRYGCELSKALASRLLHVDQLDVEQQGGVRRDDTTGTRGALFTQCRRRTQGEATSARRFNFCIGAAACMQSTASATDVCVVRRAGQDGSLSLAHLRDALVPALDDLAHADLELERRAAIARRVELLPVRQCAGVVHEHGLRTHASASDTHT